MVTPCVCAIVDVEYTKSDMTAGARLLWNEWSNFVSYIGITTLARKIKKKTINLLNRGLIYFQTLIYVVMLYIFSYISLIKKNDT